MPSVVQQTSESGLIRPADFAGTYSFYHDGWRGWLVLAHEAGSRLTGSYRGDPGGGEFTVTAEVKSNLPHCVTIVIHEFNWMVRQEFTGYLFRGSRDAIAGSTYAEGERQSYGFFARRTAALVLGRFPGAGEPVRPGDFEGRYAVSDDGTPGLLRLEADPDGGLRGDLLAAGSDRALEVRGRVDGKSAHLAELIVEDPTATSGRKLVGYLFTKTKSAIAGWSESGGLATGFYMTKLSTPSRDAGPERSPDT
jgi:hypothetical protein